MERYIAGIIVITTGIMLIFFRKKFAKDSIAYQNRVFGFHFGEREVRKTANFAPILGLILIVFGISILLNN